MFLSTREIDGSALWVDESSQAINAMANPNGRVKARGSL
jgi:hypothetical protein